jgi:hypothetical protein
VRCGSRRWNGWCKRCNTQISKGFTYVCAIQIGYSLASLAQLMLENMFRCGLTNHVTHNTAQIRSQSVFCTLQRAFEGHHLLIGFAIPWLCRVYPWRCLLAWGHGEGCTSCVGGGLPSIAARILPWSTSPPAPPHVFGITPPLCLCPRTHRTCHVNHKSIWTTNVKHSDDTTRRMQLASEQSNAKVTT